MPMIQRIQSAPPVWKYPEYRPTDKTAIFVPCYIDQFYPHAAVSMVEILDRLGVRIDFPSGQTCCGQPAFNSGAWDEARKVVRVFAKTFADYDSS